MKSFIELYEELGGMSATSLGTSVDGVLDPEDNRLPDRLGKVDQRPTLKKKKDDEVDEAKNVINEKPLKKAKAIVSYRMINDYGVVVTLDNGDSYAYDHRNPIVWKFIKKPNDKGNSKTIQVKIKDVPKEIGDSVLKAFKDNNVTKDNPDIAMGKKYKRM